MIRARASSLARWRLQSILPAPALLLCLLVFAGRSTLAATPAATKPVPVITAAVTSRPDTVRLALTGSGQAQRAAVLRAAAAGEVRELLFKAGERVERDALLVRLDDRHEELAVEMADNRVSAARQLLARYARTRASGAVPDSVIDEARTELRTARIALQQARQTLADRAVRAPFEGTVGIASVREGDRVTSGTALTTIDDRRVLRVAFSVPERYLNRLQVGQAIAVVPVADPGREHPGTITQIDSRVDPVSRDVDLLADVGNSADLLRPGMSFEVRLALPGPLRTGVPELAVQWDRDGAHVWVVREGRAVRVAVRLVRRVEGLVLVEGELRDGEPVVVEGVQRLHDGRRVAIVEGPGPGAPN
ncbi:MAG: efflux RND transporter periplasmic adaptor subunit [Burkholderiaceae bacterium]